MHESSSCFYSYQHLVLSILAIFLITLLKFVSICHPGSQGVPIASIFWTCKTAWSSFPFSLPISPSSAYLISKISHIFPFLSISFATTAKDHLLVILQCTIIFCLDYSLLACLPNFTLIPIPTDLFFSLQQEHSINSPVTDIPLHFEPSVKYCTIWSLRTFSPIDLFLATPVFSQ